MNEGGQPGGIARLRHLPRSTRWGCFALIGIIVLAMLIADPQAKEISQIRRLRTLLAAHGISCNSVNYWWSDPKGRWTLNCTSYEIDAFNNHAEVAMFIKRYKAPRQADLLRRFGASSYLVRGDRWLLITPTGRIASVAAGATAGRTIVVSASRSTPASP
ncbi:MAG: hypothetical protein QOH48_2425 [Actinomycetota bacterium]|jgi:hypothetical protein|nr:hypothetical protein [Actinomycetota bacterium]